MRILSLILAGFFLIQFHPLAYADLEDVLIDDRWDEIIFDDLSPNIFTAGDAMTGLSREIRVTSESTVSIAFRNVDIDLGATPNLSWSWFSRTSIIDTDTTQKGGDDRTLVIYVAFPYQPEEASFGDRLRRTSIELLRGSDTQDRVLTYMWGGGAARGDKIENPYTGRNGQLIYLRTPQDKPDIWYDETVNIKQDFIDAFGFAPVSPVYVGIGADSDDTQSTIKAMVKGLRFSE